MELNTGKLAAVLTHAGVKDIRPYLNGVLAERRAGVLRLVATDGHRAICWRVGPDEGEDFEVIMPRDFVKACVASKLGKVSIEVGPAALVCAAAGAIGTPIDGRFPDWRRVLAISPEAESVGAFCPEYLLDIQKAAKLAKTPWVFRQHGPTSSAAFTIGDDMAGVVMPRRWAPFEDSVFNSVI